MRTKELLERFSIEAPLAVMTRATLSRVLNSKRLDSIFERNRVNQKCGDLLFSTVVDLMALVAIKVKPSVHASYKHRIEDMNVAVKSIYNKLQGIEPSVGRGLVRETAQDLRAAINAMKKGRPNPLLPGYKVRVVDGNHLAGTEHRIKALRGLGAAALPGLAMVIFDPDYLLAVDMIGCQDGHAHETTLMPAVIDAINPGEVLIMDRGLGTKATVTALADKEAYFIARHGKGLIRNWIPISRNHQIIKQDGDVIYEQAVQFEHEGRINKCRRVTIKLSKPTRFGESEINILTNLPKRVKAQSICRAYQGRWGIEKHFCHLDRVTNSEIQSLGYPQAALFSFAVGLFMLNILNTLRIAVSAANDDKIAADDISPYHTALEITGAWKGFLIAIPNEKFDAEYSHMTMPQLGKQLVKLGKHVSLRCVMKSKRGPKRQPPKKISGNRGNHVATSRILAPSTG